MEKKKLRARKPINYYEPEEPPHDAYEFCEDCNDFVQDFCSLHGGLLVIPDDRVSGRRPHVLDAGDAARSNWMRYVNCARRRTEQNLIAYQYYGKIYYRTSRIVRAGRELLVFYGSDYAAKLNIDVRMYNKSPAQPQLIRLKIYRRNLCPDMQDGTSTLTELQTVNARVLEMNNFNRYFNKAPCDRTEMDYHSMLKSIEILERKSTKQINADYTLSDEPKVSSTSNDDILDIKDGEFDYQNDRTEKEQLEFSEDASPKIAKGNWKCKECNQSLPSREQLRTHRRVHRGPHKFNCEICDYKTDVQHYYRRHELVHKHKEATQPNEDQNHGKPHPGKTWQCGECQQIFETRDKLRHHRRSHGGSYKFKCEICEYRTDEPHFFEKHKRAKHRDRETFICGRCNYRCRNSKALEVHRALHSTAAAVRCALCPYLGARGKDVREHARRVHKHLYKFI